MSMQLIKMVIQFFILQLRKIIKLF